MSDLSWYVIHLRSNFERLTSRGLERRGFTTFLPLYRTRKAWSDRIKEVEEPLFTGYTFCRLDPRNKLPIVTTPGVISIVGSGDGPTPIEDSEILALQTMLKSGLAVAPWPFLREGQSARVVHGPLAGLEGIVLSVKNKHRLIMSVPLLQRSVSVDIDWAWVKPINRSSITRGFSKTSIPTRFAVGASPLPCN